MNRIDHLYLDTNIFIALAEGDDELSVRLWNLIEGMKRDGRFLCTSELTLAELVVLPYRKKNQQLLELYDSWFTSGGVFEIMPAGKAVLMGAAAIRARYPRIKLPDAIHLSSAIRMECSHVLSADRGIPDELEIPDSLYEGESAHTKLITLRPTSNTLDTIMEASTG